MSTAPKITEITSQSHFTTITSTNTYVVADFYADWCGPCKAIAPLFKQLADKEAKQGRMAFVKVNVDNQQAVARQFGVSAMPTFLILKNGTVTQTIRGADPSSLRTAITTASSAASTGPAKPSAAFSSSSGRTLGGPSTSSSPSSSSSSSGRGMTMPNINNVALDTSAQMNALAEWVVRSADGVGLGVPVRFVGLWLWTFFSLDAEVAADKSPFVVASVRDGGVRVGRVNG